jgi:TolB-like protein
MADERWQRVEQLYHAALGLPAGDRAPWLTAACGADDGLRHEVASLLRYDTAAAGFLERSALTLEAAAVARDREQRLVGRRLGGYEVLDFLGAGGMGEVYRARDVRLQREVALKVFEHAAGIEPIGRFESEARAASALNHPNIVTIYGVGEAGDAAYIAMELVPGRTLRDLLAEAPLPAALVLDIAVQLADAMAAAHARGIVHRDLKPENVMFTPDGRVKVLDFGIAALQRDLWEAAGATRDAPSGPGHLAGTVGYMAPEQVRGHAAVPASDQFSFGVMCHEMLAARRPCARTTRQDTPGAIASPIPIRPPPDGDAAAGFADVVSRCLSDDPADRYPDSFELLAAVRRARAALERGDAPARPGRRRMLSLGAIATLGALAGATAWRAWPRGTRRRALVVLPFGNPAGEAGTEYLCDGLAETLIRQLARATDVTVMARATAFAFKGSRAAPGTIGRQLGVGAVLAGSVTRRPGRVLISAELVDAASGARLWGSDYERPADDVLAVQNEIADAILRDGLQVFLTDRERRRLAWLPTDDPVAYDRFLLAVHHLRLGTEDDYLAAQGLLGQALARAPRFALAWVTLASTDSVMAIDGYVRPADAWPRAERHVARALAIDPDLPDAHAEAAASAFFYHWDWREAAHRWRTALALRSEVQSELLAAYALQKWAAGQPEAALALAGAARQVDPLNAGAAVREADLLSALGRLDAAAAAYERVIRALPADPRAYFGLAETRRAQGRFDEAIATRRQGHAAAGDASLDPVFARARGGAGYADIASAAARAQLEWLTARAAAGAYVSSLDLARATAQLGDAPRTFAHLAAAVDERAAGLVFLNVDPAWRRVRADPRFARVVGRVGIVRAATVL